MLTRTATDPVRYGCVLSSHGESRAKYKLAEPIPLQVEHVAVEFVEPFRPSGPCLGTMKISAHRCRVDTSYFTHNWETRGGRERLLARIGPKDRPTAVYTDVCTYVRGSSSVHSCVREIMHVCACKCMYAIVCMLIRIDL